MIAKLLTDNPWRAAALALGGIIVALLMQIYGLPLIGGGLKADLASMTELRRQEAENHRATKQNFRTAMEQAKRLEQFRLARAEAEQEKINEREKQDYDRRLADLRSRYERLRNEARASAAGAVGAKPVPALPASPFGVDAATGADGLFLAERYQCSATSIQLDSLISWIEQQAKVKVND